jgi:hypothetical protein
MPLDYKTRGYPVKDDTASYYQQQLNIYTWLLEANGFKTNGTAYLVFYHPLEHADNGSVAFHLHPVCMKTNPAPARDLFRRAVEILRMSASPASSQTCGFCQWAETSRQAV